MTVYMSCWFAFTPMAGAKNEAEYTDAWCNGVREYRLPDATRVDCLNSRAWEVDRCDRWYQAVGQSLHYAMWTGRSGGIALICTPEEARFVLRAQRLIDHYRLPLKVEVIEK